MEYQTLLLEQPHLIYDIIQAFGALFMLDHNLYTIAHFIGALSILLKTKFKKSCVCHLVFLPFDQV